MKKKVSPDTYKKAVIFRLSAMGDIVLLTGVLRHWHEEFGMNFIIVTRALFVDLFKNHPAVIEVLPLKEENLKGKAYRETCLELAQKYSDIPLFDMHASTRSRLLSSFWKEAVLRYDKLPFSRRLFLWSKGRFASEKLLSKNVCQRYASLLSEENIHRESLKPQIYLSEQEKENAKKILHDTFSINNNTQKKIIAIHPFATHLSKTLPMESWLLLSENISQRFGKSHDILWLGIGDSPANSQGKSLINKTNLRELCAILHHCDILITGDSGPMHLANAVDCKLLALFGPTCEEWGFYPIGKNVKILQKEFPCRPCSLHGSRPCPKKGACLLEITHEYILAEIDEMLR